jgi:maltooligosyltrehalose trehalohydrolase
MKIGANYSGDSKCEFVVWAPSLEKVELVIIPSTGVGHIKPVLVPMEKDQWGYWVTIVNEASPETRYLYRLEGEKERPDPSSHFQPDGVHNPSGVVDHGSFKWADENWKGIPLSQFIIYELHVGAFTPTGTFEAIIPRLDEMRDLGVNALEIMPVAQFPGKRNWGYDGVYIYAPQNSYGGPPGLKRFVNECHKRGIAVILDVIYNHLGPEGNYLWDYGPYFTRRYKTPWGTAINFDGPYSDDVRNFFIENALHWFEKYHVDALRLDAVHSIFDMSARTFLQELTETVEEFSRKQGREFYLIAESNLNDTRVIRPRESGGYGIDSQWCDDLHHSLHTLLTEENQGYYVDFGSLGQLVKSLKEGFVYSGQYSRFRRRRHGNSSKDRPAHQFVVFSQNHDQIGNRMLGERLSSLVSFEALKLAAGVIIVSPYIPLLFMGEEYGEESPFLYFVSHSDPGLVEAVRQGRKEEFKEFNWKGEPPDPDSMETFLNSKIDWEGRRKGRHRVLLHFYQSLIRLRREIPALSNCAKEDMDVLGMEKERILFMRRWKGDSHLFCVFNFNRNDVNVEANLPDGKWKKVIDSSDSLWNGPGILLPGEIRPGDQIIIRGFSMALYNKEEI